MYLLILSPPLANLSAEYIVKDKRSSGLLLKISLGFLAVSFTGASFYFRGKIPVFSLALFLGLFFCFSFSLQSKVAVNGLGNKRTTIKKYLKIHKVFSKKLCKPGTEQKFEALFTQMVKGGFSIPLLENKID